MSTMTLAQLTERFGDPINAMIALIMIEENPILDLLPFYPYEGIGIVNPMEVTRGAAQQAGIGQEITAKNPSQVVKGPLNTATTLVADIELNKLVAAQSSGGGDELLFQEVNSKSAKISELLNIGISGMSGIDGLDVVEEFKSLPELTPVDRLTPSTGGQALSYEALDELVDMVKPKPDFLAMSERTLRSFRSLLRQMNGNNLEHIQVPMHIQGRQRKFVSFDGIPVVGIPYLSVTETVDGAALTGGTMSSVYAVRSDRGSTRGGATFIYPKYSPDAGIHLELVGTNHKKDEETHRLKQYVNMMSDNSKAIARLHSINN